MTTNETLHEVEMLAGRLKYEEQENLRLRSELQKLQSTLTIKE